MSRGPPSVFKLINSDYFLVGYSYLYSSLLSTNFKAGLFWYRSDPVDHVGLVSNMQVVQAVADMCSPVRHCVFFR